jgi:hypothetical protein
MKKTPLTLLALLIAVGVCTAQKPDWLTGKSAKFPNAFYLVGVGSGKTREAAENQARAGIAKIFKADISAATGMVTTETITTKDKKVSADLNEKTVSDVEVAVKKTLEGTEIADFWEDTETGTMHALAVLKRSAAQSILEEQIQQKDEEIAVLGKSIGESAQKLEKLRLMLRQKSLMVAREELNSDHRIVDPANQGIQAPFSIEKEKTKIASFLKNEFQVGVSATGEESARLIQPALKALSARGLTARKATPSNQASMDLIVTLESDLDPSTEPVDEWYYCRWQVNMTATDQRDGSAVATDSKKGKAGQLSVKESRKKAIAEMTKSVQDLAETVWNTLSGEEQ